MVKNINLKYLFITPLPFLIITISKIRIDFRSFLEKTRLFKVIILYFDRKLGIFVFCNGIVKHKFVLQSDGPIIESLDEMRIKP
jgi:hypothetical protein